MTRPHPLIGQKVWITTPPTYYGSKKVVEFQAGKPWTPQEGEITSYDPTPYRKGHDFFIHFPSLEEGWWYPKSEINSFTNICQQILNEDNPNHANTQTPHRGRTSRKAPKTRNYRRPPR